MSKAAVVAFGFGVPHAVASNREIARLAGEWAGKVRGPVYTQLDVQLPRGIDFVPTPEDPGHPPPTLRIARNAVRWAQRQGIEDLLVVAARPHLQRARRDVLEAVREQRAEITVYDCYQDVAGTSVDFWFSPYSRQWRGRWWIYWNVRDWILLHMPLWLYKWVAS